MDSIKIIGYKSIKEATVELRPINLLIGANGSGKSNFLSFFEFINRLYDRKLQEYVALNGGASKMMHKGSKATNELSATIKFKDGVNSYSFTVKEGNDSFIFTEENLWYLNNPWQISNYGNEANVKTDGKYRSKYVRSHLSSFKKYHFHDTGKQSPFNRPSHIENDIHFSYEKGENLAAFLYYILRTNQQVYNRIINTIQSIAPYFSDFYLQPNEEGFVRLQWQDKYSSTIYGVTDLSDGTIRFIALTTLFLDRKSVV